MSQNIPKTLCITNDFGPRAGGIESFVIGLIERAPFGSVIVYTGTQIGSEAYDRSWSENFGVTVIRDRAKILLPTPRVAKRCQEIVKRENVLNVFFGAAAPLGLLSHGLRKAGAERIVALTHGHEVWWAKLPPFRWALRRIGNGVDALTYLGSFTGGEVSKALSTKARLAMVQIAPGIDTEHFQPQIEIEELRNSLDLQGKRVIVSVGRLVHRKGQDTLVEALPRIIAEFPDAHLLFVGVGPHLKNIHKRAVLLGVLDHITFVGRVQYQELPQFFSLGEIFAMPSRSRFAGLEVEGLGIVYLEASSCGLPVVGGKSGGAPDALIEGETGFAVDGRNSDEVSNAIIKLLRDPIAAKAMGARGREWVVAEWEWSKWSKKFNALLSEG